MTNQQKIRGAVKDARAALKADRQAEALNCLIVALETIIDEEPTTAQPKPSDQGTFGEGLPAKTGPTTH